MLKLALEQIRDGHFSPNNPTLFQDIYNSIAHSDRYFLCADYEDYIRAQRDVNHVFRVCSNVSIIPCMHYYHCYH